MTTYTLYKESDDVFKGNHPNGIYEGHFVTSQNKPEVVIGERYYFEGFGRYLHTSIATEIVSDTEEETIFKTVNSTYKITKNDNNRD